MLQVGYFSLLHIVETHEKIFSDFEKEKKISVRKIPTRNLETILRKQYNLIQNRIHYRVF